MNEVKQKAIKSLVEQPAWKYIEEVFNEEILEGKKPLNFKTEGKSAETIALEVMAREMASKIVFKVLNRFKSIGKTASIKKESYK